MDLHDDIVIGGVAVGQVLKGKSIDAGIAVSNGDRLHESALLERVVEMCLDVEVEAEARGAIPQCRNTPG